MKKLLKKVSKEATDEIKKVSKEIDTFADNLIEDENNGVHIETKMHLRKLAKKLKELL